MKNLMLTTALVCGAATGVSAQEITYGGLMASYGTFSTPGADFDASILDAELGVAIDAFDFWVSGTQISADVDGLAANLNADLLTIGAGYSFGNGFRVDASSTDLSAGAIFGINIGVDEFGIAYDNGTYYGRLAYAALNQDTGGQFDGLYGLTAGYNFSDAAEISLSVHGVDGDVSGVNPIFILSGSYDAGNWDAELEALSTKISGTDLTIATLGGSYDFTNEWSVYGAYTFADLGIDANLMRIGASYAMNDTYKLFADYTYADADGVSGNIDGFSFGVSMDFGDKPGSYETQIDRVTNVLKTALTFDY
ncbi:hypothetical protein [Celeribacter naphthalenivorans]|uniref:hypothetical protein n=1 Tax=Celeribacter naphthalenivorans TaxID=1614694 RepID=UPI001CFACB66|nr:hypothetical protein [Celeribacter naphthalenivorans]